MNTRAADFRSDRQPPPITDGQLVRLTLDGDRAAFDQLIKRYQRQAMAVSYRLLGNPQDAQEVTQNAFLKAFTSLGSLQKHDAFAGWLMRIVSNLSLNFRRGRKKWQSLSLDDAPGTMEHAAQHLVAAGESTIRDGDPLHHLQSEEMGKSLRQALDQLPEKQRMAIILFTIEQMSQKQVAAALKCSVEAVKWHVFQGRKKLKELLKEHL
jgi:RNA polymerase sigma-70 factor (ECF subfamily)